MNPIDNQNYKTNESVGKMFLHSCLGKFIIFVAILVVLFIIAVLTKPTDQEMRDEMNDNIMQCMEMNDSIRGDQIEGWPGMAEDIRQVQPSGDLQPLVLPHGLRL